MARARQRRSGGRGRSSARNGYWDGIQLPEIVVNTIGAAPIIVDGVSHETNNGVVERIRGWITIRNGGTDSLNGIVECGIKIMHVTFDDAQVMADDNRGLDTDEEDIARRQLWNYHTVLPAQPAAAAVEPDVRIVVDVKAKVKISGSGKEGVVVLVDAGINARLVFSCYLRAWIRKA